MDKSASSNLTSVFIKNFKAAKSVTLSDCRRINVLIGRPNVGKSNILEALAMFDVPYMVIHQTNPLETFSVSRIPQTCFTMELLQLLWKYLPMAI